MIIYRVDEITMFRLNTDSTDPNDDIYYEAMHRNAGYFENLDAAINYIARETKRICGKNYEKITIKEFENTKYKMYPSDSYDVRRSHYVYQTPTAVDDGSKFIYLINDILVHDAEDKRYKARSITFEKGEQNDKSV